jgi:hypothetical protein
VRESEGQNAFIVVTLDIMLFSSALNLWVLLRREHYGEMKLVEPARNGTIQFFQIESRRGDLRLGAISDGCNYVSAALGEAVNYECLTAYGIPAEGLSTM